MSLTRNELATVEGAPVTIHLAAETEPGARLEFDFIDRISLLDFPDRNDHFAKNLIDRSSFNTQRQILSEHSNQKIFISVLLKVTQRMQALKLTVWPILCLSSAVN